MNRLKRIIKTDSIRHAVFWPSVSIVGLFVVITVLNHKQMDIFFNDLQSGIATNAGWFFILVTNLLLLFCIYLAVGRFRNVRIGGEHARPEYSRLGWFAMLFSAGMGIGLLFWSVAEPISHYSNPPVGEGYTIASANQAMNLSFLHWGLHAWGIYVVVGLTLAFFTFNRKLPLTISSAFYPLLGERVYGPLGNVIDILAVMATLFGLATSLGLGAQQVNSGLDFLINTGDSIAIQIIIIACITAVATVSVVLGIKKGIKRLSELNIVIGAVFLATMIAIGPTVFMIDSFLQNTGNYIQKLPYTSLWTGVYRQTNWQNDWTVFYWAWWIAWSPFVGMFIARISKGRTVKEFVWSVLLVPSLLTFLWISAFGGAALHLQINEAADLVSAVGENVSTALFVLLENFPYSFISGTLAVILVIGFFVTSSDSGSLVIDTLTSGGKLNPPVGQKIFWAVTEGVVACALLLGGGLKALQTASITAGLPFAAIVLVMCFCLYKGLKMELKTKKINL